METKEWMEEYAMALGNMVSNLIQQRKKSHKDQPKGSTEETYREGLARLLGSQVGA